VAGRERRPQVERPDMPRRLIELGKDVLIAALTCSAIFLTANMPPFARLPLASQSAAPAPPRVRESRAAAPCLMAVRSQKGLYGVGYDEALVGRLFERLSPLLGEALSTAQTPEAVTARRWQSLLKAPGVCCIFQGELPVSVLAGWLNSDAAFAGEDAQAVLLAWEGGTVWLCWRSGETYRAARTGVAWKGRMAAALEEYPPNGAAYAFELVKNDAAYETLDPFTLVTMASTQPAVYLQTAPDLTGQEAMDRLAASLDFQGASAYAAADGWSAMNEGTDRLRVSREGEAVFHAREESRYTIPGKGDSATAAEAARGVWELLDRAAGEWIGEGELVLTGCEGLPNGGWTVTFHYRLSGIPVLVEEGWAAQFTVRGRQISDFTLRLRGYAALDETVPLPPERLAAAALKSLPGEGDRLGLRYSGAGDGTVRAGWAVWEAR